MTTVTCQELQTAAYVDGELAPAEERAVERHLEGCPACRVLVADLRTVRAAAFTLDRHEPPADLFARIQAPGIREMICSLGLRCIPVHT